MRGLEAGAGLAVIAVIVVFFGGGELLGDVLRSGGPGMESKALRSLRKQERSRGSFSEE